jgi:hypothetical protein
MTQYTILGCRGKVILELAIGRFGTGNGFRVLERDQNLTVTAPKIE